MSTSIRPEEIEHFSRDSARWWDEDGPFRPLHRLNPLRIRYIRGQILKNESIRDNNRPLKGLKILDVGCGGGLVCEPLARLGAAVTGIDADATAIATAKDHAQKVGLDIDYRKAAAETTKGTFDTVIALEIIEHVVDPAAFIKSCADLCKPGGLLIMSTLNRTPKSFLLGIVAAEYLLRWVPQGTHNWRQFVKPSEAAAAMENAGVKPLDIQGYRYSPLTGLFDFAPDNPSVNYFITGRKTKS